jgi:hypothetical protein
MYLVAIAWVYVVLLMSLVEATSSQGSVLGAIITFGLYGALPISLVMYLMGTPQRRAARRRAEAAALASQKADDGGHTPAEPLAAEREKP